MRGSPPVWRVIAVLAAALPAGCAMPPAPMNPFLGAWATPENNELMFREATVVVNPSGAARPIEMSPQECAGRFRFDYTRKSREALTALAQQQPDLQVQLGNLLQRPDYPVAELACDQGANTYVLLDDRDLVAVYRDGNIASIERLKRL